MVDIHMTTTSINNMAPMTSIDKNPEGAHTHYDHTPKPKGTHRNMISTDKNRPNPQTIHTSLSHTLTLVGPHPLNDLASRKSKQKGLVRRGPVTQSPNTTFRHHWKPTTSNKNSHIHNIPNTLCDNLT